VTDKEVFAFLVSRIIRYQEGMDMDMIAKPPEDLFLVVLISDY
jgi:hypothetical protein